MRSSVARVAATVAEHQAKRKVTDPAISVLLSIRDKNFDATMKGLSLLAQAHLESVRSVALHCAPDLADNIQKYMPNLLGAARKPPATVNKPPALKKAAGAGSEFTSPQAKVFLGPASANRSSSVEHAAGGGPRQLYSNRVLKSYKAKEDEESQPVGKMGAVGEGGVRSLTPNAREKPDASAKEVEPKAIGNFFLGTDIFGAEENDELTEMGDLNTSAEIRAFLQEGCRGESETRWEGLRRIRQLNKQCKDYEKAWNEFFGEIMEVVYESLEEDSLQVKNLGLKVLKEIIYTQGERFSDSLEQVLSVVIEHYNDERPGSAMELTC